jgi:1-acyl-sn-glycerol-3-phosphate acyltransferase
MTNPTLAAVPATPRARSRPPLPSRTLREEVRRRLVEARDRERTPPERYGFDLRAAARMFWATAVLYRHYFRAECHGLEHLPAGRCLLAANHGSHALAWDGANLITACLLDAEPARLVHAMADHRLMDLPILGAAARRIGAVDGTRATCIRLLRDDSAVLAFPEGSRTHDRTFRQRYRLSPFGPGFAHVALETQAPIVPVAVIGCEEEAPILANPRWLRKLVRTHAAPITPTLVVPLPVRYRIHVGAPIEPTGGLTAANVSATVERVRTAIEELIARGLAARRHVFW